MSRKKYKKHPINKLEILSIIIVISDDYFDKILFPNIRIFQYIYMP